MIPGLEAETVAACDATCRYVIQAMQNQATEWEGEASGLSRWFWILSATSVACGAAATLMPKVRGVELGKVLIAVATISSGILGFWRPDSQATRYRAAYGQLQVALIEHGARDLDKVRAAYKDSMRIVTSNEG